MTICSNNSTAFNAPCEPVEKNIDLKFLVDNNYITEEEAAVYTLAEQNGFDVNINVSVGLTETGVDLHERTAIEIKKTKIR